ncbi:MAG: hypothetical protein MJ107_00770 [Lachnospiraceae bacterium]|nr:hypothetical protein [Lachnospiraceae bacterium]
MEKEIKIINGKEYEFVSNFEERALWQYYSICKFLKIPAYFEEEARDTSNNIIPGHLAMYVPLNYDQKMMTLFMRSSAHLCIAYKEKLIKQGKITAEEAVGNVYYLGEFDE